MTHAPRQNYGSFLYDSISREWHGSQKRRDKLLTEVTWKATQVRQQVQLNYGGHWRECVKEWLLFWLSSAQQCARDWLCGEERNRCESGLHEHACMHSIRPPRIRQIHLYCYNSDDFAQELKSEGKIKAVVTGGSGSLGKQIVRCLIEDGNYLIYSLDLFIPAEKDRNDDVYSYIQVYWCSGKERNWLGGAQRKWLESWRQRIKEKQ